jgi:hypothetical protein
MRKKEQKTALLVLTMPDLGLLFGSPGCYIELKQSTNIAALPNTCHIR